MTDDEPNKPTLAEAMEREPSLEIEVFIAVCEQLNRLPNKAAAERLLNAVAIINGIKF
jgi:hypothetical protein